MVMDLKRKISRTLRGVTFAAMILLIASAGARAQNLPPPGAYQPIPNFTGVGAGLQFREAINDRFSGAQPIAPTLVPVTAAQLAAVPAINGGLLYCSNCHGNASCSSGGNGSVAFGMGGDWNCNLANAGGLNSVSNDTNVTGALSSGGTVLSLGWNGILPGSRGGTGCGAPVAFSALPGSPVTGTTCTITDAQSCLVGTAITGGGSATKCQITWNGASWMPAGGAAGVSGGGVSNAVLYAANYSGATWAEQVEAASAALPSYGGTVDAQGLCTSGTLTTADENLPLGTSSKPVKLLLGPCTYPLGTHQIQAYQGATLSGVSWEATNITCTGAGPCIAYGNSAGNYGVTFENFTVSGNSTTGSVGINWSQLFQSQAWAVTVAGFDIGMNFGDGNVYVEAAYYDHIYNSHISGISYAVNFTASANQDSITGGTVNGYGGVGVLMAGQVDTLDNVDIEGTTTPVEISGAYNVVRTGYGNSFVIEPAAQFNMIYGTQGPVTDNSGNRSNYIDIPSDGWVPYYVAAQDAIGLGINAAGGAPALAFFANFSSHTADFEYGPAGGYVWQTGHAPIGLGGVHNYGGINAKGAVITQPLPNPNPPTCTVVGTPGTASIKYAVQAFDYSGVGCGGGGSTAATLVSSDTTVSNAPNTLNGTNYVSCTWGSGQSFDGTQCWALVKNDTTAAYPVNASYASGVWTGNDNGNLGFSSYTAPSRNSTGDVTVANGNVTIAALSPGVACINATGTLFTCPSPTATATASATPTATSTP